MLPVEKEEDTRWAKDCTESCILKKGRREMVCVRSWENWSGFDVSLVRIHRTRQRFWLSLRKIFVFSLRFWVACFYSNSQSISMNKVLSDSWGDLLSIFIATGTVLLLPERSVTR